MGVSVIMGWTLAADSSNFFDAWMGLEFNESLVLVPITLFVGTLFLVLTTVGYPVAFAIANWYRKWYVSAVCGLLALGFEVTILAHIRSGHKVVFFWPFAVWPLLIGCLSCASILRIIISKVVPGLTDIWL